MGNSHTTKHNADDVADHGAEHGVEDLAGQGQAADDGAHEIPQRSETLGTSFESDMYVDK